MEELFKTIEKLLESLRIGNDFGYYDNLEFELLQLNSLISDEEYDYEKQKLENSIEWSQEFNRERVKQKSDVTTTRILEELLREKIFTEKSQKNLVEKYNKKQKGYIRIADHIKGRFIREATDEKRQRLVEAMQK